jgi:hypothetical protein
LKHALNQNPINVTNHSLRALSSRTSFFNTYINEFTLGNVLHNPRLFLFEYPRAGNEGGPETMKGSSGQNSRFTPELVMRAICLYLEASFDVPRKGEASITNWCYIYMTSKDLDCFETFRIHATPIFWIQRNQAQPRNSRE